MTTAAAELLLLCIYKIIIIKLLLQQSIDDSLPKRDRRALSGPGCLLRRRWLFTLLSMSRPANGQSFLGGSNQEKCHTPR